MNAFLFKVITREYYRQNNGFFLVLVLVCFGLFRGEEHVALAQQAMKSPSFLALVYLSFWTLYTVKASLFVVKSIHHPRQEFLYHLRLLPVKNQFLQFVTVQVGLLTPILAYAAFMEFRGGMAGTLPTMLLIPAWFLLLLVLPVFLYLRAIKRPNSSQRLIPSAFFQSVSLPGFYSLFFVRHLLEDEKMMLFLSKVLSCFFVVGVCRLYPTDDYDHRLISIGLLIAGLSHTRICNQFHAFEQVQMLFIRNLPLGVWRQLGMQLQPYLILLLPEMVLLMFNLPGPVGFGYLPQGLIFLAGLVFWLHQYLYFNPNNPDRQGRDFALVFFFMLLTIMFRVPVWIPGLVFLAWAGWIFKRSYRKVEYPVE